ncbi:hypothetical protein G7Y89_g2074 [Cudoniella acicularis]|uniref:Sulfite oxidase n=1 Tax=Cudoniella acicularis TaxID=354080 RepID=A0A8H4RW07_9HELO|nr:hypothetical protein G7Y89_g2074 [Cudoniella acicularis]
MESETILLSLDKIPTMMNAAPARASIQPDSSSATRHPPAPHLLDTFRTPDTNNSHGRGSYHSLKTQNQNRRPRLKPFYDKSARTQATSHVQNLSEAKFVWSDGLDFGEFSGVKADRYQKDFPLRKALSEEVLLAYEMNGKPLNKNCGGPVRLVVPGWFDTNSTKWLCRLLLQAERAKGPFMTRFYNELDLTRDDGALRPVWEVKVNSMIVFPAQDSELTCPDVEVRGWAWSCDSVVAVDVSVDDGKTWIGAEVGPRTDFSWQEFMQVVSLPSLGRHRLTARATSRSGLQQPISGRRNHMHTVDIHLHEQSLT